MACCGKGTKVTQAAAAQQSVSSLARKTQIVTNSSLGGAMTASAGSAGFIYLEYTGNGLTSVYDGPVTNTRYRFGKDRPRGWVDKRDAGERGKAGGFLNVKRPDGSWLFEVLKDGDSGSKTSAKTESVDVQPVKTATKSVVDVQVDPKVVVAAAPKPVTEFPDPSELNASEIRGLTLSKEQWRLVYEKELSDKNRKSVVTYIEERLADD